ncbi:MAG: CDP-alcohol phosphatidyltransferase family protein [Minisyncoccia bacterium]
MLEQHIPAGPHLEFIDSFLKRTVLRLIPNSVSPNSVTVVRFISIPLVIWLLLTQHYAWGAALFALGVFTDALDGAMARTRGQITQWGKIADPLADKLLIGSTALILVTQYVNIWVAVLIVGIELLLVARAVYRYTHGQTAGANAAGKVKMVIQSVALLALFCYVLSGTAVYLTAATWGLYVAIPSALASFFLAPAA